MCFVEMVNGRGPIAYAVVNRSGFLGTGEHHYSVFDWGDRSPLCRHPQYWVV
jgi:hypothetical protein